MCGKFIFFDPPNKRSVQRLTAWHLRLKARPFFKSSNIFQLQNALAYHSVTHAYSHCARIRSCEIFFLANFFSVWENLLMRWWENERGRVFSHFFLVLMVSITNVFSLYFQMLLVVVWGGIPYSSNEKMKFRILRLLQFSSLICLVKSNLRDESVRVAPFQPSVLRPYYDYIVVGGGSTGWVMRDPKS